MIVDKPYLHWISVLPSGTDFPLAYKGHLLTKDEYLEYWGKWIIMGDRDYLDSLAHQLDPFVESRQIQSIKYTREPEVELGMDTGAMLVFCDERERDEVWGILESVGITLKAWFYDRQTIEMWQPGAPLIEAWLESQGITGKEADEIREKTKKRYDRWLENIGEDGKQQGSPWTFELM